jgi:hypothetical protein
MVLKNVRVGLTCEVSNGVFGLGLLVLSCLFGLGLQDMSGSIGVHFSVEGASSHCHRHPMYKLSIANNMSFSMQNQKTIVGSTNQLLAMFGEDYQGQ